MAQVSSHTLITTLGKSNLLTAQQLAAAQELVAAGGEMTDGRTLAKELVRREWITRWQARQLLAGQSMFFLGKYKLLDQIGRGGMGAVFRAEHTMMGRVVAIKVMSRQLVNKPEAAARFQREVESVAKLNHPNIVAAFDADSVGSTHFLVMEYVPGRDLKYWLVRHSPLPIAWVCECGRQAALGLQHAHEHGLIHRDIKPGNLLVVARNFDTPPELKILDMGLARLADHTLQGDVTQSGVVVGTPDYISPEQAEETRTVDIRSDIFSLGCTLFHLLCGQLPFTGDSLMAKLLARVRQPAPPLRQFRPDVSPGLEAVVAKMLAREPAERYQTPAEVAEALEPFCDEDSDAHVMLDDSPADVPSPSTLSSTSDIDGASSPNAELGEFLAALADRADADTPDVDGSDTIQTQLDPLRLKEKDDEQATPSSGTHRRRKSRLPLIVGATSGAMLLMLLVGLLVFQPWEGDDPPIVQNNRKAKSKQGQDKKQPPVTKPKKNRQKADPPTPPKAVALEPGQKADVIARLNVERDAIRGAWSLEGGRLIVPNEDDTLLQLPLTPPEEYVLTVAAQRQAGAGSLSLGLLAGKARLRLVLDGSPGPVAGLGNPLSGLELIDGKPFSENETSHKNRLLRDGQSNLIVCTVRRDRIHVTCNDQTVLRWSIDPSRLSLPPAFDGVHPEALFLAGNSAGFAISKLELSVPEKRGPPRLVAGKPLDLLDRIEPAADTVRGNWRFVGDGIAVPRTEGGALLELPVRPPESYVLTVVAKRTDQEQRFLGLGLVVNGRQTMAAIDADGRSGLHRINGQDVHRDPLVAERSVFAGQQPVTIVCHVRKGRVHVACDGKVLFDWHGLPSQLSADPNWTLLEKSGLFLGSNNAGFHISKLELSLPTSEPPVVQETLVVGTGANDFPDLNAAISKAKPGDTVLIRHRGPLEFSPVQLTGKTPLTIAGDRQGDADFWPILRQVRVREDTELGQADGLFQAEDLKLTLRRVHLAVGGERRDALRAVFAMGSGRVELDQCSVTVSHGGQYYDPPGQPVALMNTGPRPSQRSELVLKQSLVRGLRLGSCVRLRGAGAVHVNAEGTTWAGGTAPWISAGGFAGTMQISLRSSTIYNAASLLSWQASRGGAAEQNAVIVDAAATLFVGPAANREPLIAWTAREPEDGFLAAVKSKQVVWKGAGNVFHGFGGYYKAAEGLATVADWRSLWGQGETSGAREVDPMFRVRPAAYELQETVPRDFQPRFGLHTIAKNRINDPDLGADFAKQPRAPAAILHRPPATEELAAKPRGKPRIRRVHQREGPFKSLEEAFVDLRDGDIIEIADDTTYTPKRDFTVSPGPAVLVSTVPRLTIRSADGAEPVIMLRHEAQQGLAVNADDPKTLYLFSSSREAGSTLVLEGLHLRTISTKAKPCAISWSPPQGPKLFRVTNCTFAEPAAFGASHVLEFQSGGMQWFENCLYFRGAGMPGDEGPPGYVHLINPRHNYQAVRNCVFDGTFSSWRWVEETKARFDFQRNIFSQHVAKLPPEAFPYSIASYDNLVLSPRGVVQSDPAALAQGSFAGGNNALWVGARALTPRERNTGPNRWFPGEVVKTAPQFQGRSSQRIPYNRYRLRSNQPTARMARDGGPVGVRFEYLPKLPAMPPNYFK